MPSPRTRRTGAQKRYTSFEYADLYLSIIPDSEALPEIVKVQGPVKSVFGTGLDKLLRTCFAHRSPSSAFTAAIRLIYITSPGYLSRNDVLSLKLPKVRGVELVIQLNLPNAQMMPPGVNSYGSILDFLPACPLALLLSTPPASIEMDRYTWEVEDEWTRRMLNPVLRREVAFDWLLAERPRRHRIALVGGGPLWDIRKGSYQARRIFEAAQALNLSIVVLDKAGHWLDSRRYSHLREDFIAIQNFNEEDLVNTVKDIGFDGLVTFSAEYALATAKAAEFLGLPTESHAAITRAIYRDRTHKFLQNSDDQVQMLTNAEVLKSLLSSEAVNFLTYPLTMQLCRRDIYCGAMRVQNKEDLRIAIQRLKKQGHGKHEITLEKYVDGPEINFNVVLWDGAMISCDLTDCFPHMADAEDATSNDSFAETVTFLQTPWRPGLWPLKAECTESLLGMGFRSGVFQIKGRILGSIYSYKERLGVVDFYQERPSSRQDYPDGQLQLYILDIKTLPSDIASVSASIYAYGVDPVGLHLLRCIEDRKRFEALSWHHPDGPRTVTVRIPFPREKIYVPANFFEQIIERLENHHVIRWVQVAELLVQPEEIVEDVNRLGIVGYMVLGITNAYPRLEILRSTLQIQQAAKEVLDSALKDVERQGYVFL